MEKTRDEIPLPGQLLVLIEVLKSFMINGMKLITWNVNGLRSVEKKGFFDFLKSEKPDVLCLQEIKVKPEQLDPESPLLRPAGYTAFWNPAQKPGYSGVLTYVREKKFSSELAKGLDTNCSIDDEEADQEGRVLELHFSDMVVVNTYFPNSQRDHARLPFKLRFCAKIHKRLEGLRKSGKVILICGDFNIAHTALDLANPKTNQDNAGFLPEERAWMDQFVARGWIDTFREFHQGNGHYTWWSYRPGVREKNVGWRLDYFFVAGERRDAVKSVSIHASVKGSDHCPYEITLR